METLYPGLYLQEVAGESPIEGVSTSTGAYAGVTERGPVGKSGFVTSWKDFQKQYGGYLENSYLPYSVRGFFENGGTRAYISRVVKFDALGVKQSAQATFTLQNSEVPAVVIGIFDAYSDGTYGNAIEVDISAGKTLGNFTVSVSENEQFVEKFENISHVDLDETINNASTTIKYTAIDETLPLPIGKFSLAGGLDGLEDLGDTDYIGDESLHNGIYAFDNNDINILSIPGVPTVGVIAGITAYVEKRKDCNAIVEVPFGMSPTEALVFKNVTANISSSRVAIFYSWLQVSDPIGVGKNPTKFIPPSGHVMGVYARTDATRGVWKAPAGIEAVIRGAIGLEYNTNNAEQAILNPDGVNAIRSFEGEGIVIWGSRTCSPSAEWKYISVRRSADYVGQSILTGTRWAVFEPNDPTLWRKVTSVGEAFLRSYWRAGGLRGANEKEAFFFECNGNTTTADDVDAGRLFSNIGIATQKPAEFVIFRLSLL